MKKENKNKCGAYTTIALATMIGITTGLFLTRYTNQLSASLWGLFVTITTILLLFKPEEITDALRRARESFREGLLQRWKSFKKKITPKWFNRPKKPGLSVAEKAERSRNRRRFMKGSGVFLVRILTLLLPWGSVVAAMYLVGIKPQLFLNSDFSVANLVMFCIFCAAALIFLVAITVIAVYTGEEKIPLYNIPFKKLFKGLGQFQPWVILPKVAWVACLLFVEGVCCVYWETIQGACLFLKETATEDRALVVQYATVFYVLGILAGLAGLGFFAGPIFGVLGALTAYYQKKWCLKNNWKLVYWEIYARNRIPQLDSEE